MTQDSTLLFCLIEKEDFDTLRSFIVSSWLVAVEMSELTVSSALRLKSCWRVA